MQLGAMGQQLGATGREEVAQPTHEHRTSWGDTEKRGKQTESLFPHPVTPDSGRTLFGMTEFF